MASPSTVNTNGWASQSPIRTSSTTRCRNCGRLIAANSTRVRPASTRLRISMSSSIEVIRCSDSVMRTKSSLRFAGARRSRWLRRISRDPSATDIGVRNSCEVTEMKRVFISETSRSFSSIRAVSASMRLRSVMSRMKITNSSAVTGAARNSTMRCASVPPKSASNAKVSSPFNARVPASRHRASRRPLMLPATAESPCKSGARDSEWRAWCRFKMVPSARSRTTRSGMAFNRA